MEVTPRSELVKELVLQSLRRDPDERAAFIQESCEDDELLANEVKSLLKFHREDDDRFESPPLRVAAGNLALRALQDIKHRFSGDVGRYRIVREIGHGGMGVVYEGLRIDGEFDQRVAIKLIASGRDSEFVFHRFRKERQILANLNHPNIARLLDGGTTEDGTPYLVMEYVDGLTIDSYAEINNLTTIERLELFCTVCAAVQYAHQHFVIHRDLKPTNILVDESGAPKLLDFGIAKVLAPQSTKNTRTLTTAVLVMTPEYSSPEQVRGEGITAATDIYSLGVVLYKILTGRLPYQFRSSRIDEVARVISTEVPPKPSTVVESKRTDSPVGSTSLQTALSENPQREASRRKLRGDLDNIILMALRKEPERRYQSVEQFSEDIRRHLNGFPVIARPDTISYRTNRFVKRNKTLIATGLIVALICLVLGSFFTRFSVRAKPRTSVGVLPFVNTAGDPDLDYLCEGITDNLLVRLSQIPGLKVPGHNSVFRYRGKPLNPQEVSSELGVETLLSGKVAFVGGEILVGIVITDGTTHQSIFSKQYRARPFDLQAMQAEIKDDVGAALGWKVDDASSERAARGTTNSEAYNLYLKGTYSWNQRTHESLVIAQKYYQQAIALDPNYALAYSGLANSYSLLGAYLVLPPKESFAQAKPNARKALELDPNLPEAHNSMALIAWLYDWDWDLAEREFKRSIALNHNYTLAHHWYGLFLGEMDRGEESIAEEKLALGLDPLSVPITADLGRVYYFARRYDESYREIKKAGTLMGDTNAGDVAENMRDLLEQIGRVDELRQRTPSLALGIALKRGGLQGYWRAQLAEEATTRKLLPGKDDDWRRSFTMAALMARLGEKDQAIAELELAYQSRNHLMTQLKVNPAFDNLRTDPRFIALLRRMKLENQTAPN